MGSTEINCATPHNPSPDARLWTMRDGTEVAMRPICPEDEPCMVKFHTTLSDRTVYMRYFTCLSLARRTTHDRLARICYPDQERELVLVAEVERPESAEKDIVAVGRLNKLRVPGEAEAAVLVCDKYQHQGLGTELLRRVIAGATGMGVHRIVAEVLRDNLAIQTVFRRLGFRMRLRRDPSTIQMILDL